MDLLVIETDGTWKQTDSLKTAFENAPLGAELDSAAELDIGSSQRQAQVGSTECSTFYPDSLARTMVPAPVGREVRRKVLDHGTLFSSAALEPG